MRPECRETRFFAWPHDLLPVTFGWQRESRVLSDDAIADALGCSRKTVQRWRDLGMDYWSADRLATRVLRVHPETVWANWRYRTTLANIWEDA